MSNSKLYGKFLPIKSPNILKHLSDLYVKYKDKADLSKYVISNEDKPKDSISYSYAKKLKSYFDNKPDRNSEEFILKGGDQLKNYINKLLSSERHMIYRHKNVKSNVGMENQFIKTHEKSFLKPTTLDTFKPKSGAEDISLTEKYEIKTQKRPNGYTGQLFKDNKYYYGLKGCLSTEEAVINNFKEIINKDKTMKEACVVVIIGEDKKLLLGQRSINDDWQPGKFAIFGGGKEIGETNEECVIREVKEETNLDLTNPFFSFSKQEGSTLVHFYVGFINNIEEINVTDEHDTFKWVDTEELTEIPLVPNLIKDITKCLSIFYENNYLK